MLARHTCDAKLTRLQGGTLYGTAMDMGAALGIAALVVSVIALLMSSTLSARQVGVMRDANHIPAVINLRLCYVRGQP